MLLSTITQVGRYFAPRSKCSKCCLVMMMILLVTIVVGYRSGVLQYILERRLLGRRHYTKDELVAMIPFEVNKRILNQNGLRVGQEPMVVSHSNLSAAYQSLECKPVDPRVVFFIRIAKCASTSFVHLLRTLSTSSSFDLFFHPSGAFDWDVRTMKQVADLAKSKQRKYVYARHFYYVDFHPFNLKDYTYITFIRDPVSRFISSYLYYHFSSKAHIQTILDPAHKNESLMSCLEHQHEGCTHNLMTKYFCGHHRFCKLGNEEALRTAKENLRNDFVAVGLVEEMDKSLKVFIKTLPTLFRNLDQEPVLRNVDNKNEHHMEFSDEEKHAVQNANLADMELYRCARELLHEKALACGLQ